MDECVGLNPSYSAWWLGYKPWICADFPRDFVAWAGQYNHKTRCKGSGRPLIKTSKRNGSSLQTALYYVRLTTHDGSPLFEQSDALIDAPNPQASLATIVADELFQLANRHHGVVVDQWILVPDALHALISLEEMRHSLEPKAKGKPRLLTAFVAELKAATAKRINLVRNQLGASVWRRSYNEQLVEDEMMLARLRKKLNESESIIMAG